MKILKTIALLLASQMAFSQKNSVDSFSRELNWLLKTKQDYEKFKRSTGGRADRYAYLRDSCYNVYIARIDKIKKNSAQYIKYIDGEFQNPELDKRPLLFYNYVNLVLPFDRNEYTISMRDFYRVIKHTLLERDARILPETLDDLPFPVRRDYYRPFKLQTEEDFFTEEPENPK